MAYSSSIGPFLRGEQAIAKLDQPESPKEVGADREDSRSVAIVGAARPRDGRIGRPPNPAEDAKPLSPEERDETVILINKPLTKAAAPRPVAEKPPRAVSRLLVGGFIAAVVSALLLFASACIAQLGSLPLWSQWAAYVALAVLSATVLVPVVRLAILYHSLPKVSQVIIENDGQIRIDGKEDDIAAERWLKGFLEKYSKAELEQILCDSDPPLKHLDGIRECLSNESHGASEAWIRRFHDECQKPLLDTWAVARIKRHARFAAVQVAISPNPLVDTLVMAYYSFAMLEELCQIYRVRADRLGTAVLLGRIFFTAYVAGRLDESEDFAGKTLDSFWDEAGLKSDVGNALAGMASQVISKAAAKAATGFAAYVMLRRLGAHGVRLLQPVRQL